MLDTELLNRHLIPVEECGIGQRTLTYDSDYKAIAALSTSEMVTDMTVFFTHDLRDKKKDVTVENIQKQFDLYTTKKIIRKLVLLGEKDSLRVLIYLLNVYRRC